MIGRRTGIRAARAAVIPLLLALAAVLLLRVDLREVAGLLGAAAPLPLAAAVGVYLGAVVLRATRWHRLLAEHPGARVSRAVAARAVIGANALNALLPARAGEVYRVVASARDGLGYAAATGALLAERLLDLAVLAVMAALACLAAFGTRLPPALAGIALAAAAFGLLALPLLALPPGAAVRLAARLPLPGRLARHAAALAGGAGAVHRGSLPALAALTGGAWVAEGLRLALVAASLGLAGRLPWPEWLLVALVGAVLSALPLTPAGLGIAEAGIVTLLTALAGLSPAEAMALALLDRAVNTYAALPLALAAGIDARLRGAGERPAPGRPSPDAAAAGD